MSLKDLTNVEVTSVSKTGEPLSRAPAAVYARPADPALGIRRPMVGRFPAAEC